jgi:nuclear transport factor 2 (NTF2) superfamily protein
MTTATDVRPPLPPFTLESAIEKIRKAEDAWNSRDPAKVALAYTIDSRWRNRSEFLQGRAQIIEFLTARRCRHHVGRSSQAPAPAVDT